MTEKQFKIFDAMAEPRSENAIRKAEERKEKRQQLKMKQINTIKSLCVDEAYLSQWYQGSVDANPPVWTDEHIKELFKDFYLIPKDSIVPNFERGDKVLINCRETKSEMTKMLFDVINDSCQVHNIYDDDKLIGSFKEWEIGYMCNDFLKDSPYEEIESITEDEWCEDVE